MAAVARFYFLMVFGLQRAFVRLRSTTTVSIDRGSKAGGRARHGLILQRCTSVAYDNNRVLGNV